MEVKNPRCGQWGGSWRAWAHEVTGVWAAVGVGAGPGLVQVLAMSHVPE